MLRSIGKQSGECVESVTTAMRRRASSNLPAKIGDFFCGRFSAIFSRLLELRLKLFIVRLQHCKSHLSSTLTTLAKMYYCNLSDMTRIYDLRLPVWSMYPMQPFQKLPRTKNGRTNKIFLRQWHRNTMTTRLVHIFTYWLKERRCCWQRNINFHTSIYEKRLISSIVKLHVHVKKSINS